MHTTSSDGALSPLQLVEKVAAAGVTVMAITDHDSMEGVDALRGVETLIPVLQGVELSIRGMKNLHLLGYGVGEAHELRAVLRDLAEKRESRGARILEKLEALGMPIDAASMDYQGSLGRPHIAQAMVKAGYVRDIKEAFDRYLHDGGPAYVGGERLNMEEALALLRRNGFVPVLAHPAELGIDDVTLRALLEAWQKQGLMGVEVYHPSQSGKGYAGLERMVRRMDLLLTGGSDFHREYDKHGMPGCISDAWVHAEDDLQALYAAMKQ